MSQLFIANISWKATETMLQKLFSQFGELQMCRLTTDTEGKSKGYGFVKYVDDANSERAISELNGFEFMGRNLVVKVSEPNSK